MSPEEYEALSESVPLAVATWCNSTPVPIVEIVNVTPTESIETDVVVVVNWLATFVAATLIAVSAVNHANVEYNYIV
jgi:hypothetical protein